MKKTENQIKKELSEEYWGEQASKYDLNRVEDPRNAAVVKIQEDITKSFLNEPYKNILDIACGTGRFFKLYHGKIYGIDISEDMLKEAKKRKGNLILKKADGENIPYKNDFFDVSITSQFIKHTPFYQNVIKEMARVTKKGGAIIIDFPNRYSITYPITKIRIKLGKLRHYNFFSFNDIKDIAAKNNLKIERIEPTVAISLKFSPKFMLNFSIGLNKIITKFFPHLTYVYYVKFRKK